MCSRYNEQGKTQITFKIDNEKAKRVVQSRNNSLTITIGLKELQNIILRSQIVTLYLGIQIKLNPPLQTCTSIIY